MNLLEEGHVMPFQLENQREPEMSWNYELAPSS
jgi:hypothetical protein